MDGPAPCGLHLATLFRLFRFLASRIDRRHVDAKNSALQNVGPLRFVDRREQLDAPADMVGESRTANLNTGGVCVRAPFLLGG